MKYILRTEISFHLNSRVNIAYLGTGFVDLQENARVICPKVGSDIVDRDEDKIFICCGWIYNSKEQLRRKYKYVYSKG